MRLSALCLAAAMTLCAAEPARIFYSKSFPGSKPPYVSIEVLKTGAAVYKEAPDDGDPAEFQLSAEDTTALFDLVEKLERFKRPLESGLKVANMGMKTFRYVDGAVNHEVKFNYSLDENAKLLADWFERMVESQQLWFELERTVKFDRLGVNDSILKLEAAWDRKRLVAPQRFLPLLDRVVKNDGYLNMARERAASLAAAFRNPAPQTRAQAQ